ncbi:MAG: glucose 1-dehydrogenase [Ignavibacteriales bacterium]|nr:glucose 1-dehydrogenase [Ignavibacteriales bacterium]
MERMKGKVAIITGGAGGIGVAAGKLFREEGAKVMLVDLYEDALKEAVEKVGGEDTSYAVADVSKPDQVKSYVEKAKEKYGSIDAFLNNAGIEGDIKPVEEYPVELFDKLIGVNIRGTWLGLKYVMPVMKNQENGGAIVMTSSVAGLGGMAGLMPYVTSKHGLVGMTRSAALEGAEKKVRVNAVNPSPVDTRMMRSLEKNMGDEEKAKEQFNQMIPLGRYAEPEEIADLMLFLASDESKFITGAVHAIDGGMTAQI